VAPDLDGSATADDEAGALEAATAAAALGPFAAPRTTGADAGGALKRGVSMIAATGAAAASVFGAGDMRAAAPVEALEAPEANGEAASF
jgi:hypothetical protein